MMKKNLRAVALLLGLSAVLVSYSQGKHECVDLGLPSGTLWATCNIGAESPEDFGDFFTWGEIEAKEDYNWDTMKCYAYKNGKNAYSVYNESDNLTTLKPSDDAATAIWGDKYHMPTKEEWEELIDNCKWEWTSQNGHNGYKVTGKSGGKSIFLPMTGYRSEKKLFEEDSFGYYWTSSLFGHAGFAWRVALGSGNVRNCNYWYRYLGYGVRPVCKP